MPSTPRLPSGMRLAGRNSQVRHRRRTVLRGLAAGLGASAAGLVLASACAPLPFVGQMPRVARVVWAWSGAAANASDALRDGLREAGWLEGQNLVIEERHYGDHPEQMPQLAAELLAWKPDVLVGSQIPSVAFQQATNSIPIVFTGVADPVGLGLVASYARPGGNITGTSRTAGSTLTRKLLDLLGQLVPGLARLAVVFDEGVRSSLADLREVEATARSLGIEVQAVRTSAAEDPRPGLSAALAGQPQALLAAAGGVNPILQPAVFSFATEHQLPTATTQAFTSGALLYYGPNAHDLTRRAANYHVDRILRGAKPGDLPVEGPTVFDVIVNRTVARALDLMIPPDFAAQITDWVD